MLTYYDILRVPGDADDKEIKAAYRQAALAYHPDHIPKGVSKRMRDDAAQAWLEIQEAFSVLGDPRQREEYDTRLEELRQSEEAEKQFESVTPQPTPRPKPPPTPQQNAPQPAPQPQSTPPTKSRSAWLRFCFQAGRHWREACLIVAVVLFVANGARDSEAWTVMSVGIIFTSIMAVAILVASGPSWRDKRRYIVNVLTLVALFITGITAMSISTPAPAPKIAAIPTTQPASLTATNKILSSSTTPSTEILKKHGFERMPPACEKVLLNELDSCLTKVKVGFEQAYPKSVQETEKTYHKAQAAIQNAAAGDNLWLTQLPEEYLFACFESDRSRCSTSITHLKYQPKQNILLETGEFQDYFQDTDKKFKPSPGRWHATCPLHARKDGHWIGQCTYKLLWSEEGKPPETVCTLTTSEEITELTREGIVSGITGKIDWTPRHDALNPECPEDSGNKKEFHLVPKQ